MTMIAMISIVIIFILAYFINDFEKSIVQCDNFISEGLLND